MTTGRINQVAILPTPRTLRTKISNSSALCYITRLPITTQKHENPHQSKSQTSTIRGIQASLGMCVRAHIRTGKQNLLAIPVHQYQPRTKFSYSNLNQLFTDHAHTTHGTPFVPLRDTHTTVQQICLPSIAHTWHNKILHCTNHERLNKHFHSSFQLLRIA